jgi:hypothetical protein
MYKNSKKHRKLFHHILINNRAYQHKAVKGNNARILILNLIVRERCRERHLEGGLRARGGTLE